MPNTPLKLVNGADDEIAAVEREIKEKQKADGLAKAGAAKTGDVLPPEGAYTYDDLSNAERFLSIYGDDLLFLTEAKKWLFWNGRHWQTDQENIVNELACEFVKTLYSPENLAGNEAAFKHAKRSNNASGIEAMLKIARAKKSLAAVQLDAHPRLLNCHNGTVDLQTGEIRPHDRNDRITKIVNSAYDPDAESPAYKDFLETIQPDPDIRSFLQRSIGYSLLGVARERSFWILYGTGANGKSVFTNLFNNLLGEYASTTTAASVMQGKASSIPNDIARLRGKRFVVIPETEENERLNAALIKALSAGDNISARFLFGEWFDFYFSGKLWIATNHKPRINDHSKGFWDRLKLVPFTASIPPEKIIKQDDLLATLQAESAGIMNWAIQGCRDYFEIDGLDVPEVIQKEIEAYRYEQDSILQFIDECCETMAVFQAKYPDVYVNDEDFKADNTKIFQAYVKYCEETGEHKWGRRLFSQKLKERGFHQQPVNGKRVWKGIRLEVEV